MIGIACTVIIGLMTGDAFRGRVAVSVTVTSGTILLFMRPRQRKIRIIMIKIRRRPLACIMAGDAVMTEIIGGVVRIRGIVKVRAVTAPAIARCVAVAVAVAVDAVHGSMRPRQRKIRIGVVKTGRRPLVCRVARFAVMAEIIGSMVRIRGIVEIRAVTAKTIPG